MTNLEFEGYRRPDGRVGVRDLVAVVPISVSASPVAERIADEATERVRATPHGMATQLSTAARTRTERVLAGIASHPNVGAALVVELGVEDVRADDVVDAAAGGRPVETLSVREAGGARAAVERGVERVDALTDGAEGRLETADASELVVGVECGGSDATSGIAANPAVGAAADRLVEAGGAVCISEVPEFIGAEHLLAERCADDAVRERLLEAVDRRERLAEGMGVDVRGAQPSPGNQEGGLTTIEEKSLGAIAKGGTTPLRDVVGYAERLPVGGGLMAMDTPGYDVESVSGKVAGGAGIVVFTTGRGSTTGNPVAPVVKVCGNPETSERMATNMDVNASTVLDGDSVSAVGERILETVLATADGTPTAAEARRLEEFAVTDPALAEEAGVDPAGLVGGERA
jgi:altronate dehydratase large subunit